MGRFLKNKAKREEIVLTPTPVHEFPVNNPQKIGAK